MIHGVDKVALLPVSHSAFIPISRSVKPLECLVLSIPRTYVITSGRFSQNVRFSAFTLVPMTVSANERLTRFELISHCDSTIYEITYSIKITLSLYGIRNEKLFY